MRYARIQRAFPTDPDQLLPAITPENEPHWSALADGRLVVQKCEQCGELRFPVAPVCPHCGGTASNWTELNGSCRIFSWVRYHRTYLPEFADLLPYVVVCVEVADTVRMFGRLVGHCEAPVIDTPVRMVIEEWPNGRCVPAFSIDGDIE